MNQQLFYVEVEGDLVTKVVDYDTGIPLPKYLEDMPLDYLRYDGQRVVYAKEYSTFYIDEKGVKHIKQLDPLWQEVVCRFTDELKYNKTKKQWVVKYDSLEMEYARKQVVEQAERILADYIHEHYPDVKQRSDMIDKEYYVSTLLEALAKSESNNTSSLTDVYTVIANVAREVYTQNKTLQDAVKELLSKWNVTNPHTEIIKAVEQLLKVALRVGFVQACKNVLRTFKEKLQHAQSPVHCYVLLEQMFDRDNLPAFPTIEDNSTS